MNSKVLEHEYKENLDNGLTLYYGAMNEESPKTIQMTVKGKFKPNIDLKYYSDNIKATKESFITKGNKIFGNCDWIEKHYIFVSDFTECGITKTKSCKFKYTVYVNPIEIKHIKDFKEQILCLVGLLNNELVKIFSDNGFELD